MNPLNGLSSLGLALKELTDGVRRVSASIRRAGAEARRRADGLMAAVL